MRFLGLSFLAFAISVSGQSTFQSQVASMSPSPLPTNPGRTAGSNMPNFGSTSYKNTHIVSTIVNRAFHYSYLRLMQTIACQQGLHFDQ
jgi:hypothetical protein